MKFNNAVCICHWLNLRRKRDVRAVNEFEKIGARLKMRAARGPNQQRRQREKTFHAAIFRIAAGITRQLGNVLISAERGLQPASRHEMTGH